MALKDELRPEVIRWLEGLSATALRGLNRAAIRIRRQTVINMRAQLRRRTGKRAPLVAESVRIKVERRLGAHPYAQLSFKRGILAAHELGSTIPGGVTRPRFKKILAWGGTPGGTDHIHFAREVHRPTRTLRRRPMLEPAYYTVEPEVLAFLDEEYQRTFAPGTTAAAITDRIGG